MRAKLAAGATLDELLPEAFATVREASRRVLGLRHFDVQMIGGMVLHDGKIAEMKTGEGKTLVATLPVYLNALAGHGVHVVTVNDYLAQRDAEWMGQLYNFLGMSVRRHRPRPGRQPAPRPAYAADITYGTNNEFGFDYLRDNMKYRLEDMVQREFFYGIVDEVDSILIDEARTPLIISGPSEDSSDLYRTGQRRRPRTGARTRAIRKGREIQDGDADRGRVGKASKTCCAMPASSPRAISTTSSTSRSCITCSSRCAPTRCSRATSTTSCATTRSSSSTNSPAA